MRNIDIHAHLTPQCFWRATDDGGNWHTLRREQDANGRPILVSGTGRGQLPPKASWTPEQRLADMDSLERGCPRCLALRRVLQLRHGHRRHHRNFAGVQRRNQPDDSVLARPVLRIGDPAHAGRARRHNAELERVMVDLGFKGAMIDDKINGKLAGRTGVHALLEGRRAVGGGHPLPPVRRYHRRSAHQALPSAQLGRATWPIAR